MTHTVIIHVSNEDPICGELDQLPAATDTIVTIHNPRRRDGKDIPYLSNDVITVIWPINQITYIEVMPGEGEESIIGFVRE
jgi:hypothetical protein